MDYENFCNEVFKLDRKIRYVGIFHKNKIYTRMRKGMQNLLSPEDTRCSLNDTMIRWKIRRSLSDKIGNPRYAMAAYDKIMRFTVPIDDGIILISTEPDVYPKILITEILDIKDRYFSKTKFMIAKDESELLRVKYRFKDEMEFVTVTITGQQYINHLELPIIETCEIVSKAEKPVSEEEKEMFNEKIRIAYENDPSHTKYLLE